MKEAKVKLKFSGLITLVAVLAACQQASPGQTALAGGAAGPLRSQALTIPSTPQSWDYRIAKVVTDTAQQVVNQDVWDATPASIAALHSRGKKVICYFSAGTWEYDNFSRVIVNQALTDRNSNGVLDGSGDPAEAQAVSAALQNGKSTYVYGGQTLNLSADQLTFKALAGSTLPGWDEYVYRIAGFTPGSATPAHTLLRQIMQGHMARAAAIGCDALEPDNLDAYSNVSDGITAANQYQFNKWLADTAHASNQKIYLKNDLEQIADGGNGVPAGAGQGLVHFFDGLVNEECFTYKECQYAAPFRDQGKPIFVRQYTVKSSCDTYKRGKIGGKTRQQIANEFHLNVSVSAYENGGNPDANANPPKCTFGTW